MPTPKGRKRIPGNVRRNAKGRLIPRRKATRRKSKK